MNILYFNVGCRKDFFFGLELSWFEASMFATKTACNCALASELTSHKYCNILSAPHKCSTLNCFLLEDQIIVEVLDCC